VATVTHIETARGRRVEFQPLLTPGEVARMFRVDPKTVTRWAKSGKLEHVRTPGGHRRYDEASVRKFLADWQTS
jgi:excisionase family DNA binding protein